MNMMFFPKFSLSLNFYVLLVLCLCVYAQEPFDRAKCESLVECGSCLQHLGCFWCLRPKLRNTLNTTVLNHCISENNNDIVCSSNDLINPKSISEVIEDRPLQSKSGSIVQMKPQRIRLTLRIGESYNLRFQYSQAENYPVDLYYIIDNSYSMSVHKEKLSKLGTKLAETMRGITNDFRIGFGSFMDKVNLPFTGIEPNQLKNPCPSRKQKCVSPYSFKNHMALSTDFQRFATEIMNAGPSANLDSPEGGFDAIMQTIVCKKEIGWRPQARHLIIFSTDAQFHIAGDGKLAGIIETNDAECHMINNNYDGLYNDYPSVSQLNYVAKENNINLIFATVKTPYGDDRTYRKLSQEVENSKFDRLDEDSRNVIKLVVDNYKKIVNSVTMETNATDNIQVRITPHCKRPIEDGCANIRLGEVVNFTATIKPLKCVAGSDGPTIISVKPNGIDESLIVELETICRCNCESPEHLSYEKNAPVCTNAGDLVCGVCMCNKNRHGSNCECDNEFSLGLNETNCREDKPGAVVCSGLGICKCGKCECKSNPNTGKKYRGKYCDCDDDSCDRENGKLCNEKGTCSCGTCICNAGWTGTSCKCPDNNRTCIREGDSDVCSGKGSCYCGKCECYDKYTGTYCGVCPTCKEQCVNIMDCVECTVFKTGKYNRIECEKKCFIHRIVTVDEVVVSVDDEDKICRAFDKKKCEIVYKYNYDESDNLIITVRKEKICEINLWVWVLAVIGSILVIGLITLIIWKLFTMFVDKREYEKFINEQKESKWHTNKNPLFKNPTTSFENPFYPH